MQCKEWDDANSELFKESHDEAVHKNSYKSRLYELISASLGALQLPTNPVPLPPQGETGNIEEISNCRLTGRRQHSAVRFLGSVSLAPQKCDLCRHVPPLEMTGQPRSHKSKFPNVLLPRSGSCMTY